MKARMRSAFVPILLFLLLASVTAVAQAPAAADGSLKLPSGGLTDPKKLFVAHDFNSYVRFDLSHMPAGIVPQEVAKATLRLYLGEVHNPGTFDIVAVTSPWEEAILKDGNGPTLGGVVARAISVGGTQKDEYVLVDITPQVQAWISGAPNYGVAFIPSQGSPISIEFDSKETTETSHDPELIISLKGPTGPQGPQGPQGPEGPQGPQGPGISSVGTGTGLLGGPITSSGTISLDTNFTDNRYPRLAAANTFTGSQTVNGNLSATSVSATGGILAGNVSASGLVTGAGFNIGSDAFAFGSKAGENAFLGFAGNTTSTGTRNTGSGSQVLLGNTTGSDNTAMGTTALLNNTTGGGNTAHGSTALQNNSSGSYNVATGTNALLFNTTGSLNTGIGHQALYHNTTGVYNAALGDEAGPDQDHPDLSFATAIGALARVTQSNSLVLGAISGVNGAPNSTKVGIGTTAPARTLDVVGDAQFSEAVTFGKPVTFAADQTFPGTGNGTITGVTAGTGLTGGGSSGNVTLNLNTANLITSVTAGTGLSGGGTSGNVTLSLNPASAVTGVTAGNGLTGGGTGAVNLALDATKVPLLTAANTFTGNQTVNGNLSATNLGVTGSVVASSVSASGLVTGAGFNIGSDAFAFGSKAGENAFLGFAGNTSSTGTNNTASGNRVLLSNSTGSDNTGMGRTALYSNTTGSGNAATGSGALQNNSSGNYNAATGASALIFNTTGWHNTATGYQALYYNRTGMGNTALGTLAGPDESHPDLSNATAIGARATVTQSNSLVLGSIAGLNGAAVSTKVGIGTTAPARTLDVVGDAQFSEAVTFGKPVTFAADQTFPGTGNGTITGVTAGTGLTGGGSSGNVTLNLNTANLITSVTAGTGLSGGGTSGNVTLSLNPASVVTGVTAGNGLSGGGTGAVNLALDTTKVPLLTAANTFTGNQTVNGNLSATNLGVTGSVVASSVSASGLVTGAGFNIGSDAFAHGSKTSGNTFLGFAGNQTATGRTSTGIGVEALLGLTSGAANTAVGWGALRLNTSANSNSAFGYGALFLNTTGYSNTAAGTDALHDNDTGSNNSAVGGGALFSNTTGIFNTAVGYEAMRLNIAGQFNAAIGDHALYWNTNDLNTAAGAYALASNTGGHNNTAAGEHALFNNVGGTYNTALGSWAGPSNTQQNLTNATAIGARALVAQSDSMVLGSIAGVNGATASTKVGIGTTAPAYALDVRGGQINASGGLCMNGTCMSSWPAGTGTVTSITAGTGLTGGTITTSGTIALADTVALKNVTNTFTAAQTVNGTDTSLTVGGGTIGIFASGSMHGIKAASAINHGIFGSTTGPEGSAGVYGTSENNIGVRGHTGSGYGVYGEANTGYAGYFAGNVHVAGTLSKASGTFKIDHPLDPANKYLSHSFVESPDMMNIYNGNVTTDGSGLATVELPDWFEALNRDFRYQLTVIGQFAQAIVEQEVKNNHFSIKTDKPGVKVSWQVTGIRHDAYADKHRIRVEENKPANERGKYLHPDLFGAGPEQAIGAQSPHPSQAKATAGSGAVKPQ